MKKRKCNICNEEHYCETHHIQSKCYGGTNYNQNLCKLCPNHHKEVHLGLIIIEGWFSTSTGKTLIHRKKGDESITGLPDPMVWLYADMKGNQGKKMDRIRGMIVEALTNAFQKIFPIGDGSYIILGNQYQMRKDGKWFSWYVASLKEVDRYLREAVLINENKKPKRQKHSGKIK